MPVLARAVALVALILCAATGGAMPPDAPVLNLERSRIVDTWRGGLVLEFALGAAVPYGVGVAADPDRLEVTLDGVTGNTGSGIDADSARRAGPPEAMRTDRGLAVRVALSRPMRLSEAEMQVANDGSAMLRVLMVPSDAAAFRTDAALWAARPDGTDLRPPAVSVDRAHGGPLRVMLDPGHGGLDPGAEHGGIREADLVLDVAREVSAQLRAAGVEVMLTRDGDDYVPLAERVARANRARAHLFISLHADAVRTGRATGASVHLLPENRGADADRFLLDRLGPNALAVGSAAPGDAELRTLMQVARPRTQRQAEAAAEALVRGLADADIVLYKTPVKRSNFVVLRAADMPSLLVELGFLSDPEDRARLTDPAWRSRMVNALAAGIRDWAGVPLPE